MTTTNDRYKLNPDNPGWIMGVGSTSEISARCHQHACE